MKNNQITHRNQKPWSRKAFLSSFLEVSELVLFESGVAKRFRQGTYYSCKYPAGSSYIQVCITRNHADGSVNCFLATIDEDTGEILGALISFCLDKELFDQTCQKIGLQPVEDKKALERLVYDAEKAHRGLGLKFHHEFHPGMKILEFRSDELISENVKHIAHFQKSIGERDQNDSRPSPTEASEAEKSKAERKKEAEKREPTSFTERPQEDFTRLRTSSMPIYQSSYCAEWDAVRWTEFIYKERKLEDDSLLDPANFQPLLFLFEKAWLPPLETDPYVMGALNFLGKLHPILRDNPYYDNVYQYDFPEDIVPSSQYQQILDTKDKAQMEAICLKLEVAQEQNPQNPYYGILLHQFYSALEQELKAYRQACRLYNFCPDRETAVAVYFSEIHTHEKYQLIQQLMDKSVLLENHIPYRPDTYYAVTYYFYYHTLAQVLADTNKWPEFWKLMQVFKNNIDPHQYPTLAESWQDLYFEPVYHMNAVLCTTENPRLKAGLLKNILKYTKNRS